MKKIFYNIRFVFYGFLLSMIFKTFITIFNINISSGTAMLILTVIGIVLIPFIFKLDNKFVKGKSING